jgi:hypothetical protein
LGFVYKLDLESAPTTVYCPGLQWQRPEVDGDAVVVELPVAVRAWESDPFLEVVRSQ